ncbi:endonuclease/exonuclease/phosphatase family protein [Nocardioides panaciterrulae]|uniref:Endonuclease/exonuclease/phosphatase family metal-dependent hydrolase n=1 Tax=Nocardioides panaciterrulae TaxID=661492 RepID=A0A7Y9E844_9ACTN|nr:endonuclease/exonuclease/phosphatase family protein [Nocardioides panaciterrulae]NYD42884.1 endonuclease/exonuclease/phosphatase family metal-dependent hydrolase [Nocardioides panaciterrulae]
MSLRIRARLAAACLVTLGLALAGPATLDAAQAGDQPHGHHHGHHHRHHGPGQLDVMTQNLYLGSPLTPALAATTPAEFVAAVAQIYGTMVATDFPKRAQAIADTIAHERPDLIGLEEVSKWTATPLVAGANPPSYDFLAILQAALAKRGLHYSVAAVSDNADIGPAPLVAPDFGCGVPTSPTTPQCVVRLQDRDVVLVDDATRGLAVRDSASGEYTAQQTFAPPGTTEPVSFARGWAYIDASYVGKRFRFLVTHLETEDFPAVQEAQAKEFLAGPAHTRGTVIAVGDFNSAADPATTTQPTASYSLLTKSWFDDAWLEAGHGPGLSCCQNGTLSNPTSQLSERIDLVLLHGRVRAINAHLVDDQPISTTPPFWPSDHAGVVARVRLPIW